MDGPPAWLWLVRCGIQGHLEREGGGGEGPKAAGAHSQCNGSGERVEPDQTARSALQTLVSIASDPNIAAQTFQALVASRDEMLQHAAHEQRESLRQHASVRDDSDFLRAWRGYQERRISRPGGGSS